jgi:hypothetical protein
MSPSSNFVNWKALKVFDFYSLFSAHHEKKNDKIVINHVGDKDSASVLTFIEVIRFSLAI